MSTCEISFRTAMGSAECKIRTYCVMLEQNNKDNTHQFPHFVNYRVDFVGEEVRESIGYI